MAILFTLRVFARNLLRRKSPKKYFSYFVLMSGLGDSNPGFSSNKPTHYLLDHGDFDARQQNDQNFQRVPVQQPLLVQSLFIKFCLRSRLWRQLIIHAVDCVGIQKGRQFTGERRGQSIISFRCPDGLNGSVLHLMCHGRGFDSHQKL